MKRSAVVGLASFLLVTCLTSLTSAVYHPRLGRFISRDPMGYVNGPAVYQYSQSSPAGHVDAQGTACCCTAQPEKCWIAIDFKMPLFELHKTTTGGRTGYQMFAAVSVTVEVKHTGERKDEVKDCHLQQDVYTETSYPAPLDPGQVLQHEWSAAEPWQQKARFRDYSSKNPPTRAYRGYHYEDRPAIWNTWPGIPLGRVYHGMHMRVFVEEAPTVDASYGLWQEAVSKDPRVWYSKGGYYKNLEADKANLSLDMDHNPLEAEIVEQDSRLVEP